jgi:hypothetical protein
MRWWQRVKGEKTETGYEETVKSKRSLQGKEEKEVKTGMY